MRAINRGVVALAAITLLGLAFAAVSDAQNNIGGQAVVPYRIDPTGRACTTTSPFILYLSQLYNCQSSVYAAYTTGGAFTNPMTTLGDLILGGSAGAAGRLAIGANATVLASNGTTAAWSNNPALSAANMTSFPASLMTTSTVLGSAQVPTFTGDVTASGLALTVGAIGGKTVSLSGNFATTGAFNVTLAVPSSSTWTLPAGPSTLLSTTGNALTSTTSTNLAGGLLGSIPYQSAVNTTALLAGNTAATDQVLVSHGDGVLGAAPTLSNAPALSAANMTGLTLAQLPAIANSTVMGNISGSTGAPQAMTAANMNTIMGATPATTGHPGVVKPDGTSITVSAGLISANPVIPALTYGSIATSTACNSSASPAVCAAAPVGVVTIAAAATTKVVNTTAVTANSEIFLQFDSSLGTLLSVTCNTTYAAPTVSARTAATSFTISTAAAPTTNPACYSYKIVN